MAPPVLTEEPREPTPVEADGEAEEVASQGAEESTEVAAVGEKAPAVVAPPPAPIVEEKEITDDEWGSAETRGHKNFRVFMSAEPAGHIPVGILQRSIKLTQEPPRGLQANMMRCMGCFSEETWEASSKQSEFKAILFSLCYFHAVVVERKKFGPQGWNRNYPFNLGDLTTCIAVLNNYLEDRPKIPWDDLRYVFGEIMYGGHITDDWDRSLCKTYLMNCIRAEVVEGIDLAPGLASPQSLSYKGYLEYIEKETPPESPLLYGLHPNAEINFRTVQGDVLFRTITELQPRGASGGTGALSDQEVIRNTLDEIVNNLPEMHNLPEIAERLEDDRGPFQNVFYQECERMNFLLEVVARTLKELDLGLKGALAMTTSMQQLADSLFLDQVPEQWSNYSFMSMRPLAGWFNNLQDRNQQLAEWTTDLQTPKAVWLSGFFNPMAYLTAIMQTIALANSYDLDNMILTTEVLKKWPDQIEAPAREGAYIHGLYMEGARWDMNQGSVEDSKMKELYPKLPVLLMKSLPIPKVDLRDLYACPVYKTQERGPGYVCTCYLKTKHDPRKWVIGGVAMLMDVVE
eukprot:NODE_326_length_2088_cov_110.843957_g320_i0.p1 GENE.NODE_326_length_2088_cov_110.843957_g320_i0~~NODE_326_length_2088_cov_110.843957_g320_i0.p1  ORF type:complete len:660 (+),score=234.76 NODE_326_length_2088_cov_110.843957_g320_i0:262-1980(+)